MLVTPGERVDVIVTPKGKAGAPLTLRAMLYNRGYGSVEYRAVEEVLTIEFTKDAAGRGEAGHRHANLAGAVDRRREPG